MKRLLPILILSSLLSMHAHAKRAIPPELKKWWPMCVFDGTGGASEPAIKEMVRMAAECGVMLEIFPKAFNFAAEDPEQLAMGASDTCNISTGFKDRGVTRGSVLAIVPDTGTAQAMCKAAGAGERSFCGQLGFDPGKSFKFRMGNTGYYGDVANPGASAFSVVSGKSVNARDMSAAALGQGMMALPQGFGAGNGVGGDYEGQAAGGSNVDSGWSDYGCEKMREAAYDNIYPNKMYFPLKEIFAKKNDGKLVTIDLYDKTRRLFGNGGVSGANIPLSPAIPPAGIPNAGPDFPFGNKTGKQPSVMDNVGVARAPQSTASPTGHPNRASAGADGVVNLRQSAEETPAVNVAIKEPTPGTPQDRGKIVNVDKEMTDDQLAAYGLTRADVEGKTGSAATSSAATASTSTSTSSTGTATGSSTPSGATSTNASTGTAVASAATPTSGQTATANAATASTTGSSNTSSNTSTSSMFGAADASTTTGAAAANMLVQSATAGLTPTPSAGASSGVFGSELALAGQLPANGQQGGGRAPASASNFNDGVFNLNNRPAAPEEDRRGSSLRNSTTSGTSGRPAPSTEGGSYTRVGRD